MIIRTILVFLLSIGALLHSVAVQADTRLVLDVEGKGRIVIKLHTDKAPKTTSRIIELANQKFYDGQKFFKVVRSPRPFLVQMGDPLTKSKPVDEPSIGTGGTGVTIEYEDSGYKHVEGAVGMAHVPGDKDSGDSQFYIMLAQAGFLDGNYTVFGQVVEGKSVLHAIELGDKVTTAKIVKD